MASKAKTLRLGAAPGEAVCWQRRPRRQPPTQGVHGNNINTTKRRRQVPSQQRHLIYLPFVRHGSKNLMTTGQRHHCDNNQVNNIRFRIRTIGQRHQIQNQLSSGSAAGQRHQLRNQCFWLNILITQRSTAKTSKQRQE